MFASRKLALHFQIFLLQFSVFDRCERVDKLEMLNYGIVNIHYESRRTDGGHIHQEVGSHRKSQLKQQSVNTTRTLTKHLNQSI